mgnify:CR=1 FL=1
MNYKTYAEAKIANPNSEIVTTGKNWAFDKEDVGTFEAGVFDNYGGVPIFGAHLIGDHAWVICNPADYCLGLKEFLEAGYNLVYGDKIQTSKESIYTISDNNSGFNNKDDSSNKVFILSASALNGGCKIPAKAEQWTIYNNTLPLCELTDEQAAMLFNAWRSGGDAEFISDTAKDLKTGNQTFGWSDAPMPSWLDWQVYRIKSKSERELFIDKSVGLMTSETERTMERMFSAQFDAGARYKDLTQHFGENI